jgi:hypothetical protein
MTPRQQTLNRLWAWYRCAAYDARRLDWTGKEILDPVAHESIASAGFLPPGYYDAGASLPLKFRKPSAPYAMVRVIVNRFTELLFSERHHPQVHVDEDPDTDDALSAMVEASRLWPAMIQARQYGGAMGTVCMGFQFLNGVPLVEVHDPRWVIPTFSNRYTLTLKSIEKRFMYPEEVMNPAGIIEQQWFWYRRIISDESDVLFKPAPVAEGDEPIWEVAAEIAHGLGFCPVVWVQNLPVQDDVDGDPDCHGIYEIVESIDALIAQANLGTLANCDPTVVIATDGEMGEVRKGSDNAIKLPSGGNANYMEMAGSGPKAAMEMVDALRKLALEVSQCVLEHPEMSVRTATEIERLYSTMLAKADTLREQYGEKCIKPLVAMMLRAARQLGEGVVDAATGGIVRQVLSLPPKLVAKDGVTQAVQRSLGKGSILRLQWPRYFDLTLTDIELASRAAAGAKGSGLIDSTHAIQFVAEYFRVEDLRGMTERIKEEQAEAQAKLGGQMFGAMGGPT